jgi:hypothetical protein
MARSRRSRPRQAGLAFNDSIDSSYGAGSPIAGASLLSHASEAAPRSLVHRLSRLAESGSDPLSLLRTLRGYGGKAPMQALNPGLLARHVRALPVFRRRLAPTPTPKSRRSALARSWHDFNALQVRVPARVSFCVRRHRRRETLFALGIAGGRGLGRHGVRRTENSNWRC